jgi:hypothetical protein
MNHKGLSKNLKIVLLIALIIVVILICIGLYFYFKTPTPPPLPEKEVPMKTPVNDTVVPKTVKNMSNKTIVPARTSGGGGGGGGGSGGNTYNPPVVGTWGDRDLGSGGADLNETQTPELPSYKFSFSKIIDYFKGLFGF